MNFIPDRIYPNFLFIGTSKSGSSWMYEVLREHPQVFLPAAKDIQFFNRSYHKGLDWYLNFFRKARSAQAVGEIDHDYFLSEQTAERIHKHLPNVRLFCCLREPLDKTISAYLYTKSMNVNKRTRFEHYAFRPEILKDSDYYHNLLPFYRLFSKESIFVLFYDELKQDPANFVRKIYSFLDVDSDFTPPSLHKIVLPAREPRSYFTSHLAYKVGLLFRKIGLANLVGAIKRNPLFESLFYHPLQQKPEISDEIKHELRRHFQKDYDKLSEMIGQKIPEAWLKESPGEAA